MIPNRYRTVVVGAGGISNAWFGPLKKEHAHVEVVGVVDLNLEAARRRIAEHDLKCEASDNLADCLSRLKPDFVIDLTIPVAHCQVTCTALEAGCHVIGEKPMANSLTEGMKMVEAAKRANRLYMVSQSRRWDGTHEAVRQCISSNTIGPVTTLNCDFYLGAHFGGFRDEMESPLILDMAIHHFDLARFFSGAAPVAVYAHEFNPRKSWYQGDVAATCIFEMENGIVFTYRGSWCAEGCHTSWNGDWRIVGTQGTVLCEKDQAKGQIVVGETGFHRPLADLALKPVSIPQNSMHGALLEMLRYLDDGTLPQTHCEDNIYSLSMVFAAIESSRQGKRMVIADLL